MLVGSEPASGLYYEVLGSSSEQPAILFIHGGGATGACWRTDLAGGPGWADALAENGWECWVTDWPGTGRSGNRQPLEIEFDDAVDGYRRLLRDVIARPVVLVCHSMGGATTWQLVSREPDLVAGVVSVAGSYPANVAPSSEVLSDDGRHMQVRFADTGVLFNVDRQAMYLYEDAYIYDQGIATSKRFDRARVNALRAGLVGLPPRMLMQRLGVLEGLPVVEDTAGFEGMPIFCLAGSEDPAHTKKIERGTVDLLRGFGADARLSWLPDRGIEGNGHFLMFEDNQADILDVIKEHLTVIAERTAT